MKKRKKKKKHQKKKKNTKKKTTRNVIIPFLYNQLSISTSDCLSSDTILFQAIK